MLHSLRSLSLQFTWQSQTSVEISHKGPPALSPGAFRIRCAAGPAPMTDVSKLKIPHVMTVAGSDSGAGAGIQADIKTCAANGVFCSTVITAITAQNTVGVQKIDIMPEDIVAEQMSSVLSDMEVDVVKTGMIPSVGTVRVIIQFIKEFPLRALVVDPVMTSTSGDMLADSAVLTAIRNELLPMANIVTPNVKEASALLDGMKLVTVDDMKTAAKSIHGLGPQNVLVKGGDLPTAVDAVDIFFDGKDFYELSSSRIETRNSHGTGCTLASCIASGLAKGLSTLSAVKVAKRYIGSALSYGKDMGIGNGRQGPFDHMLKLKNSGQRSLAQHTFVPEDLFLYAVTDSGMNKRWGRSTANAVKDAVEGGATIVQLREKNLETRDFLEAASECVAICRRRGIPILINDRIDVALACDADGVHIGQSDMPVEVARSLLGPDKIIGVSCKTPEQAHQACAQGADYIGCGGVFPTNTKANNVTVGIDGLRRVCLGSKVPVVAIGGIDASNAGGVMEMGGVGNLKGVAVVSALFDRECVVRETQKLKEVLMKAATSKGGGGSVDRPPSSNQHLQLQSEREREIGREMDPSNSGSSSSERRRRTTSLTCSRGSLNWFMVLSFIILPVAASVIFYGLDPSDPAPYPKLLRRPTHSPRFVDGHILGQLSDVVGSGQVSGPEDIAYDRVNGWIYTGCLDGWIKRVDVKNGSSVKPVVNTGGRPLGLALGRGGKDGAEAELFIADAVKGLLKLSKEGEVVLLSNEAEGQQFKLTDGVDVADDGTVYFTDASFKYGIEDSSIDVLEARPHGRLLSFHPTTGDTIVLLKELYFPNGVALSPDQTSLIFCETTLRRCSRYHIKGSRAGTRDPFTDNIPGMPDNIHYDGQASYWIAIFASFPPFLINLMEHPFVRKVLLIMNNYSVLSAVLKNAGFLVVDLQGNQVAHLFDPTLLGVTSGLRIGQHLYSGSLHAPHILRFNLHQSHYPAIFN